MMCILRPERLAKENAMKKVIAGLVFGVALAVVAAGCESSQKSDTASAGMVGTCEKGTACCKTTGNKADCKASCADKAASCSAGSTCTDKKN